MAQPSGGSDVATAAPSTPVPYPLSSESWTQPAGELELVTGTVTYTTPASCLLFGDPNTFGNGRVRVKLASNTLISAYLPAGPASTTRTSALSTAPDIQGGGGPFLLQRPDTDTSRALTAEIEDNCAGGGDNFTVHSVTVDVVGVG